MLSVHNFQFGLLTPVAAYLVSCLGAFLGLRCAEQARAYRGNARVHWLLLAALSIGAMGIWVTHFVAMLGFAVPGETIRYDVPITVASLLLPVTVVGAGLLLVSFGREGWQSLILAGTVAGLGIVGMHYAGMSAMRMSTRINYNIPLFALSVIIAIVVATMIFWAALRLHGAALNLGAALVIGAGVSAMHYTGMAAVRVIRAPRLSGMHMGGATALGFLLPLVIGIMIVTVILVAALGMSPTAAEIRAENEAMQRIRSLGVDV